MKLDKSIISTKTINIFFLLLATFIIPFVFDSDVFLKYELPKLFLFKLIIEFWFVFKIVNDSSFIMELLKFLKKNYVYFLAFIIVLVLIYFNSDNKIAFIWGTYYKRFGLITILHLLLYIWLVRSNFQKYSTEIKSILKKLIPLSLIIMFLYSLYQQFFTDILLHTETRWVGSFGQPNFLAAYFALFLPFLIEQFNKGNNSNRIINILSIFLTLVAIYFSQSRIVILIVFIYLFYKTILLLKHFKISVPIKIFTLIMVFTLSFSILVNSRIFEVNLFEEFRLVLWKGGLELVKENLIFGLGIDNIVYYLPIRLEKLGAGEVLADRTHNEILDLLLHFGLILTVFLIYVLRKIFILLFIKIHTDWFERALKMSLLFWIGYSMVNNNGIWNYIWVSFLIGSSWPLKHKSVSQLSSNMLVIDTLKILVSAIIIIISINNFLEYSADRHFKKYLETAEIQELEKAYSLNRKEEMYWQYLLMEGIYKKNMLIESQKIHYPDTVKLYSDLKIF